MTTPPADPVQEAAMTDAAEMLWVVLANVSGGDWTKQTAEWQEAAARWRDNYFAALKAQSVPPVPADPVQEAIDCPWCGVVVKQVASATLSIALWQHVNWVCEVQKALRERAASERKEEQS